MGDGGWEELDGGRLVGGKVRWWEGLHTCMRMSMLLSKSHKHLLHPRTIKLGFIDVYPHLIPMRIDTNNLNRMCFYVFQVVLYNAL